jgi:fibro-slime domain-containing protein
VIRALIGAAFAMLVVSPALAEGTLNAQYFVLPPTHPDVGKGADGTIVRDLFANRLDGNDLPVVTALGRSYTGPSGPIHDVDAMGEVQWYGAHSTYGARRVKNGTDRLPFKFEAMFPPGKTGDGSGNGYLTAHWFGTFVLPKRGPIGFKLGSDDDSWVYVDGRLVVDNGGVKPIAYAPYTVANLSAGSHRFDVFYADRHGVGAILELSLGFAVSPTIPKKNGAPDVRSIATQLRTAGRVAVYGIHFAFDRDTIAKDSDGVIAEIAAVLRDDPHLRVRIEGHTDGAGDAAYNRDLSRRRAQSVKAYLVTRFGIAGARLETQGYGPDRPIATNATAKGRALNRRVEVVRL